MVIMNNEKIVKLSNFYMEIKAHEKECGLTIYDNSTEALRTIRVISKDPDKESYKIVQSYYKYICDCLREGKEPVLVIEEDIKFSFY